MHLHKYSCATNKKPIYFSVGSLYQKDLKINALPLNESGEKYKSVEGKMEDNRKSTKYRAVKSTKGRRKRFCKRKRQ